MLKYHNPELCNNCSKKPIPSHHSAAEIAANGPCPKHAHAHTLEKTNLKPRTKTKTVEEEEPDSAGLRQVLTVLEDEFRKLKIQYHHLVADYERIAEGMTKQSIPEADGSKNLKAIGDELRLVIQQMETKVYSFKSRVTKLLSFATLSLNLLFTRKHTAKPKHRKKLNLDVIN